jgi:two-component system copper resistance phosphate regulon response regulator CusR
MATRVLLIEDEAAIADFVLRGLREEGFEVHHAADGEAGWQALQNSSPDVILLDWWLPGLDGLEVLRRFRDIDPDTPVLFLTARGGVSDRVRGLDSGADDYLVKPFEFSELLARVRALTRRRERSSATVLTHAEVRMDLTTQRVERAGRQIELTGKEYALLLFLMRHSGQVLSRSCIYEHVWDENYDGQSNTLEVHIMELRRKLEAHGPRLIQTVRGRGYAFDLREGGGS